MMPGMIMLWHGTVATIPSGWALCDGTNGTPNLNSKFIMGAGRILPAPGGTGGTINHNHDFIGDGHSHDLGLGTDIGNRAPDGEHQHQTTTSAASGTTDNKDARPPYMILCYIMKLPLP